jgi:hypothetical protein
MKRSLRARVTLLAASILSAAALTMTTASAASAFSEPYGNVEVGNGGFIQSGGAHTFKWNDGGGTHGGTLACQLFQKEGSVNEVEHGNGACSVTYFGGQFVWARVYNQSGSGERLVGEAGT